MDTPKLIYPSHTEVFPKSGMETLFSLLHVSGPGVRGHGERRDGIYFFFSYKQSERKIKTTILKCKYKLYKEFCFSPKKILRIMAFANL